MRDAMILTCDEHNHAGVVVELIAEPIAGDGQALVAFDLPGFDRAFRIDARRIMPLDGMDADAVADLAVDVTIDNCHHFW